MDRVQVVKKEVFVYKIPPRSTNRGYRAADWNLDTPDWTGRLKGVINGDKYFIKLEDQNSSELFAQCPLEDYPSPNFEHVLDSSRYFVIKIVDPKGRNAFIGIGFADRSDSFDLVANIQDYVRHKNRDETENNEQNIDTGPKLDLRFKEGETIKINIKSKKTDDPDAVPRTKPKVSSTGLLPPPPGGSWKLGPPPVSKTPIHQSVSSSAENRSQQHDIFSSPAKNPTNNVSQNCVEGANSLIDFDALRISPEVSSNSASSTDPWGDFASANSSSDDANNWIQFG